MACPAPKMMAEEPCKPEVLAWWQREAPAFAVWVAMERPMCRGPPMPVQSRGAESPPAPVLRSLLVGRRRRPFLARRGSDPARPDVGSQVHW
jgi:hypothetical protein